MLSLSSIMLFGAHIMTFYNKLSKLKTWKYIGEAAFELIELPK
jgi:hypothetical protein